MAQPLIRDPSGSLLMTEYTGDYLNEIGEIKEVTQSKEFDRMPHHQTQAFQSDFINSPKGDNCLLKSDTEENLKKSRTIVCLKSSEKNILH